MDEYDALARLMMVERIREVNHQRATRELRRPERFATAQPATGEPQRPSRLWTFAHFHRAFTETDRVWHRPEHG